MRIATAGPFLAALGLLICMTSTGCVRREGRNADCIWPKEPDARTLDPRLRADAGHLREDVEFAEDLAIRYMDAQRRPQTGQFKLGRPPGEVMNTCRDSLLKQISTSHQVPPREVVQFFGRRRLAIDVAVILPFLLLYGLLAIVLAGWLRRRYPPEDGLIAALAMALCCSLAFGVAGLLSGEEWSLAAESIRVGTGHLSYRADRLPWARHRISFLLVCVALFWSAVAVQFRARRRQPAA